MGDLVGFRGTVQGQVVCRRCDGQLFFVAIQRSPDGRDRVPSVCCGRCGNTIEMTDEA